MFGERRGFAPPGFADRDGDRQPVNDLGLVSVIIPVFNGEAYLPDAIESVIAQTYRPIEIIVVDDGSTDGSPDTALSYPEVRLIRQRNQGHAAAKNTGIAAARGAFLAFLDADDVWAVDKLRLQTEYLAAHPDTGCVITRMHVFLEPGMEWPSWLNREHYATDPAGFVPSALLARRSVFDAIGAFDVGYRYGDDSDWFFRAKDAGVQVAVLPHVLLHKRVHPLNMSHAVSEMTSELLRVVRSSIVRGNRWSAGGEM